MQGFVDEFDLTFPQGITEDGSLWARFGVAYQPAWVFVDDDGSSTVVPKGLEADELRRTLRELLAT